MDELFDRAKVLIEALPYIQKWAGTTMVIKYGGAAMTDEALRHNVVEDVVLLHHVGIRPVLVHGGGPHISEMMKRLGHQPAFVDGQRVTDAETMRIVQMVLVGQVGQDLVGEFVRAGARAVSVSGKDAMTLKARKLQHPQHDLGFVGEVEEVNPELIRDLGEAGYIVVLSTIGVDEEGVSYNINADTAAGAVAAALRAEKLIVLSDVPGLLEDPGNPETVISELTLEEAKRLVESGRIGGGMLPKLQACVAALEGGVRRAHLIDGRVPHAMLVELFTDRGVGTMIRAD